MDAHITATTIPLSCDENFITLFAEQLTRTFEVLVFPQNTELELLSFLAPTGAQGVTMSVPSVVRPCRTSLPAASQQSFNSHSVSHNTVGTLNTSSCCNGTTRGALGHFKEN